MELLGGGDSRGFTLEGPFADRINRNGNVKSASIHHYMAGHQAGQTLQDTLMNHGHIVGNLSQFRPFIGYLKTQGDIPLYLGEVNSDIVGEMNKLEATFGAALWAVDYLLYAMSIGISRVYIQQGTSFEFDSWKPIAIDGNAPQVRPPYYGDLFIADAIGHTSNLQVVNVPLHSDYASAYALYGDGHLQKYAVVNLEDYSGMGPRTKKTFSLSLPSGVHSAHVTWLSAAGAHAHSGISWGGQSYNYSSSAANKVEVTGAPHSEVVRAGSNGRLSLTMNASSAALIHLDLPSGVSGSSNPSSDPQARSN
jgi:hypothetical protein